MSDSKQNSSPGLSEPGFMRLFLRYEPVLRAYARTILPDWSSIDDAIQEASVTMWQKIGQVENEEGFLPWAKVIVRYKCFHVVDGLRRESPLLSNEVLRLIADEAESSTMTQYAELRTALNGCLSQLSTAHQELLLAPYAGSGRVKELAEATGKSSNSLYKLLGRLREKLSNCIQSRMQSAGVQ